MSKLQARTGYGRIPEWSPPTRPPTEDWSVSTHYFPSYALRRNPLPPRTTADVSDPHPDNLVLAVNRYVPRVPPKANSITLVFAHATGTHKETWEPIISHILNMCKSSSARFSVCEMWAIEPTHHGDSAILNEGSGMIIDVLSQSVDIVELVERRLPLDPSTFDPTVPLLPRHERVQRPRVVGIGHSVGGTAIVQTALHAVSLFAGIILIEPCLAGIVTNIVDPWGKASKLIATLKETFKSKEAFIEHYKRHPMYKAWDPGMLRLMADYGLYKTSSGEYRLKTQRSTEAVMYADRQTYQTTWFMTPSLSPNLPVFFVYGSKSSIFPDWSQKKTASLPPVAESVTLDAGHFVVQEQPQLLATTIFGWMNAKDFSSDARSRL